MLSFNDMSYSVRSLARSPGFAAVTVLTLALGIGANTGIFTLVNALLLRDLPAPEPRQLVQMTGITRTGGATPFSFTMFRELEQRQGVFSGVFGASGRVTFNVEVNGALFLANVRAVTGNYFSELGATPFTGRLIVPDDAAGRARVAVISYGFWDQRFSRDPDILKKTLLVEGKLLAIIGVTPKWFTGLTPGEPPEVMVPVTASPFDIENRSLLWLFAMGRLKHDVSLQQAQLQLQTIWPEVLTASVPATSTGQRRQSFLSMRLGVQPGARGISTDLRSRFSQPLYLLMGVVGLILLIGCVNLANFMLARAAGRKNEMSIRAALGAGPWQISRQILMETLALSILGAALAFAVAYVWVPILVKFMGEGSTAPIVIDYRPDWRVFSFTAIIAGLTAILVALAPAWHLARVDPASVLGQGERTSSRTRGLMSRGLLIIQIALSVVLVVGAGLLVRTLQRLFNVNAGFQKAGVIEVSLYPRPQGYQNVDMNSYRKQMIDQVASLPGVGSVSFSNLPIPAGDNGWQQPVSSAGSDATDHNGVVATLVVISPGFFKTLGISLLSGRDFEWADAQQQERVAIIDDSLARRLSPSRNAIGQRLRFGLRQEFQDLNVVGLVNSARILDPRTADAPIIYVPYMQHQSFFQYSEQGNLLVRASQVQGLIPAVEKNIASLDREYSGGAKTVDEMYKQDLVQERAAAILSSFFALLALLTAAIGVFGLMSYNVTRRTREIGVRIALGSTGRRLLRMILGESIILIAIGLAIGLPIAVSAVHLISHMLFVSSQDPLTLIIVSVVFIALGALAAYLPARRATTVDPIDALRYE